MRDAASSFDWGSTGYRYTKNPLQMRNYFPGTEPAINLVIKVFGSSFWVHLFRSLVTLIVILRSFPFLSGRDGDSLEEVK
jgi:hypothetical protein